MAWWLLLAVGGCVEDGRDTGERRTTEAPPSTEAPPTTEAPTSEAPTTETPPLEVEVVEVVAGLEHPWALAFLPDGDLLVTERPGRLRIVRDGGLLPDPVPGIPEVAPGGHGGLLDLALAPDFDTSGDVYMTYAKPLEGGLSTTAVARARLEGDALLDLEDVFVAEALGESDHFGSRLVFDDEGMLFVTVGDRGVPEAAQDLSDHIGTTVRLHPDGTVPDDNPFVGVDGVLPEIYSYGHRNAQGMAVHPETGEIWQSEHGPAGGDEINRIVAGANYGWPLAREGDHYSGEEIPSYDEVDGVEPPLIDWTPAIAPSGLAFYTGELLAGWEGDAFVGGLSGRQLRRVRFDGTEVVEQEALLEDLDLRIRDVRSGPDGALYLLEDAPDGALLRLEPTE